MSLLHEAVDAKKFDTRTLERNVSRSVISFDDVDKATKKLPDDAENAQWVSLDSLEDEGGESFGTNGQGDSH